MSNVREHLNELLQSEEFRKEWEATECEYSLARCFIEARRNCKMTQKELALKTGIDQGDISKIETGNSNPSLSTIQRLAEGMGMVVRFEFVPKSELYKGMDIQ